MRTAADIRQANSLAIARAIHADSAATRRGLAEDAGTSFATAAAICAEMIEHGIVTEVGQQKGVAGRPTTTLALNADHGRVVGIDIAETYVHAETFNAALEPLSETRIPIDSREREPEQVAAHVIEALEAEELHHGTTPLLGVGISAPGQVDQVGGTSVFAPNWNWSNVPLLEILRGATDAPMFLDNPLKALTVAEIWSQPERSQQDFAVVNLGTGVGIGIAINGRVHRGRTNSAGEWGHTVLVADGRVCRCGARGCVEAYVGAPGIIQTLREAHPASSLTQTDDQTASIKAIREAALKGHPDALDTIDQTGRYLGLALGSLVNMLNPDLVIIGGWVAWEMGEMLLEASMSHARRQALAVPMLATDFEIQSPRHNRVSLGVAALAFEGHVKATLGNADSAGVNKPRPRSTLKSAVK